jgi:peptide/nickel transport system permease protein
MQSYIIKRLLMGAVVLLLLSFIVFMVMHLLPGDPLLFFVSQGEVSSLDVAKLSELKAEYGLDKPLMVQYFTWITNVVHGEMGKSIFYQEKVSTLIFERMPVTIYLGILAVGLGALFGVAFGMICALRRGRLIDSVLTFIANIGITAPGFWIGILLIYLFGLQLQWLPIQGYTSPFTNLGKSTMQLIMPVFCLSFFSLSSITRQTRSSMLEVVRQDYIRTAWAKGLRERTIVIRHMIKNGLIPVVTMIGMQVRVVFGGSVLIETVFNIPGFGRLLVSSVIAHDYLVVQAGVFIIAAVVIVANLLVDFSYGWLDPRIRYN